jgi:hypothetical protein
MDDANVGSVQQQQVVMEVPARQTLEELREARMRFYDDKTARRQALEALEALEVQRKRDEEETVVRERVVEQEQRLVAAEAEAQRRISERTDAVRLQALDAVRSQARLEQMLQVQQSQEQVQDARLPLPQEASLELHQIQVCTPLTAT